LSIVFCAVASIHAQTSIEIDLQEQTAYLIRGRHLVLESPISSGRYEHLTETGSFKILEKERNHYSSIYGKIVDAYGNTIVADADADMRVSPGGKFVPAPMRYLCASLAQTECTPGIYLVTRRRTVVCVCPKKARLRFSTPWKSAHL